MSRGLSAAALRSAEARETDEVWVVLLTISHESLDPPIRVCSDSVNLISRGETFVAYPFVFNLPVESEESPPRARLQIDNIDPEIIDSIRSLDRRSPPRVLAEVILAGSPDSVEAAFPDFELQGISYDTLTISGDLGLESFFREGFPAGRMDPAGFAGLF